MIAKVSTLNMPHDEWLSIRRKTIGGSDAGAILGLNQYRSAYSLWAEKTGILIPEDISDKEAVRLGNDLEQYVADRFMEATGKKVRRDNNIIYNSLYSWAHANIDRSVIGEDAGLECKVTSSWEILKQCQEGKYPDSWYCQIVHYMGVTGAKKWYLGVLCLGKGFYWFEIERNTDEINALMTAERNFMENVKNNTPPALDGSDSTDTALKTIFAESSGREMDLTGVSNHIQMHIALTKQIKELETAKAQHEAEIKSYMRDAGKGSYGNISVSWKTQSRKNFDRAKYEQICGPIPDSFFKDVTSRPFRLTVKEI